MLTKIRFKNYKSFSKETIINLEPSKSQILEKTNVYNGVLKGCCFYGPNASGKSNALEVIEILPLLFSRKIILSKDSFSLYCKDKSMFFEYTFKIDDSIIVYYFELDKECRVLKETLAINGEMKLNRLINSAESLITERKHYDSNAIDEKTLFLKNIYFNTGFAGFPCLKKLFEFIKSSIKIDQTYKSILSFGNREEGKELILMDYLNKYGTNEINTFLKEYNFPFSIEYRKEIRNISLGVGGNPYSSIIFRRVNLPDISFLNESYGNQLLLNILPSFLRVVKTGGLLIIDEFSSGLHNKLEQFLVKYFFKYSRESQIFFVSHSTNLLTMSLLRPDQVYSTDFDNGSSFIKKFSDEQPRESQNLEKMYLSGSFGGIPFYEFKD